MRSFTLLGIASCVVCAASQLVPGKSFDRFITIWLENQDYEPVINNTDFKELAKLGISQTRYYAHTHPSQPNYLAAIGGDYFGLDHDNVVRIPSNVSTVVDLLESKEISWGGYFEGLPGPGYMAEGSYADDGTWDYVRKHDPFVSYDSINTDGGRLANVLSFREFEEHVAADKLPQFIFMSPDMNNDGHNTTLEYATSWANRFLMPLLTDSTGAFGSGRTLVQLTFDETEDYSLPNRIGSLLLGNAVDEKLHGTEDDTFYTHFSILSTIEHNWLLPSLGRFDVGANVFQFVADQEPVYTANADPPAGNLAALNNSVSYPGFLNLNHTIRLDQIPPPNLKLTNGAGGQPVLEFVRDVWKSWSDAETPYDGSGSAYDGDTLPVYKPQADHNS